MRRGMLGPRGHYGGEIGVMTLTLLASLFIYSIVRADCRVARLAKRPLKAR